MKTCAPYSFGQLFRFALKRKSSANKTLLNTLGVRESEKNLIAASGESGVSFCRNSSDWQSNVAGIDCKLLGYPKMDNKKFDKLFEGIKPDGYFDTSLSNCIIRALSESNFVSLEINKVIRPVDKPTHIALHSASYISSNCYVRNGLKKINLLNKYTGYPAGNSVVGKIEIQDYKWNFLDFYIPSSNFSPQTAPDLTILPSGSIIWYWEKSENKWITCSVVHTKSKKGSKIKTDFVRLEVEEEKVKLTNIVYSSKQTTEKNLTIFFQKLIQNDNIRIVINSLKAVNATNSNYNKVQINSVMLKLLDKNFNCEFLEQLKLSIFDSSEYKNINNLHEFMELLFQRKGYPLEAKYYDKNVLNNVALHAITAAEDCAPLFWGIKETSRWESDEKKQEKIQRVLDYGFCHNSEQFLSIDLKNSLIYCSTRLASLIGINTIKSLIPSVEVNTLVDIDKKVILERDDTETYNVSISTPKYIHEMGEKAVSKFIKNKIQSLREENTLRRYLSEVGGDDSSVKFSKVKVTEGNATINKGLVNKPYGKITIKEEKIQ
jgi:predicted RNA-binding protein